MSTKKELTKDERIKKEIARLNAVFTGLDRNKATTVRSLIQNAAFMTITLEDLQKIITQDGVICEYKNGENQFGTKKSPEVEIHIAMTKNHAVIIKQLTELVPLEKKKNGKLQTLRGE